MELRRAVSGRLPQKIRYGESSYIKSLIARLSQKMRFLIQMMLVSAAVPDLIGINRLENTLMKHRGRK